MRPIDVYWTEYLQAHAVLLYDDKGHQKCRSCLAYVDCVLYIVLIIYPDCY